MTELSDPGVPEAAPALAEIGWITRRTAAAVESRRGKKKLRSTGWFIFTG